VKIDKMEIIDLYLGHPFEIREQVREWELEVEKRLRVDLVNPFYDVWREDIEKIDSGEVGKYEKCDPKKIVQRDVFNIAKTQGGIYILEDPQKVFSVGTIQEMVYSCILGKPTYSLVFNGYPNHPWIVYHSDEIFTSWNELDKFLLNKFGLL